MAEEDSQRSLTACCLQRITLFQSSPRSLPQPCARFFTPHSVHVEGQRHEYGRCVCWRFVISFFFLLSRTDCPVLEWLSFCSLSWVLSHSGSDVSSQSEHRFALADELIRLHSVSAVRVDACPPVANVVVESPIVCCEDIFNGEIAQRPPQFHKRPRKWKK